MHFAHIRGPPEGGGGGGGGGDRVRVPLFPLFPKDIFFWIFVFPIT